MTTLIKVAQDYTCSDIWYGEVKGQFGMTSFGSLQLDGGGSEDKVIVHLLIVYFEKR